MYEQKSFNKNYRDMNHLQLFHRIILNKKIYFAPLCQTVDRFIIKNKYRIASYAYKQYRVLCYCNGDISYARKFNLHREDGPAHISKNGENEYHLNLRYYSSREEYIKALQKQGLYCEKIQKLSRY